MNIFQTLVQGDSGTWSDDPITLPDGRQVDAASGWTLKYALRGPVGLDLTAVADGTSWKTTISTTASAALTPGTYSWSATVSNGSERMTVGSGQAEITPDLSALSSSSAYDGRTAAQKALAACETAMSTFNATGGRVKKYEIAGRTMEFQTIGDLLELHSFWKAKVMAEGTADALANGEGNPRNLYVRFQRAP
jgi:hypothetical protein